MVLAGVRQLFEYVVQIVFDDQVVAMGTAHDTQQLQTACRSVRMPEEQPVATADRQRTNHLFRLIVVNRQATIQEILLQCRPLVLQVTNRFAKSTARQSCPLHVYTLQPLLDLMPNRFGFALSQVVTCGRGVRLRAILNRIQC